MSIDYTFAFLAGLSGYLHCLGMCGGLAGGFFAGSGWQRPLHPVLIYHTMRIFSYSILGMAGMLLGRVVAQTGIIGKGQAVLQIFAGVGIVIIGLYLLLRTFRATGKTTGLCQTEVAIPLLSTRRTTGLSTAAIAGLINGLIPCALVFSIALKASQADSILQAAGLMVIFGMGTLPMLLVISMGGLALHCISRGKLLRLTGILVMLMGFWTIYEGWIFFDVIRGLANW